MTRRTAFNGSAAGRRRERRAALQNAVTASSEVMHRPTLSRAQIQAKGKHETPKRIEDAKSLQFMAKDAFWQLEEYKRQIERAAIVFENEISKPADSKNHRIYYRDVNPLGNKIHAVQKQRGKSIPAYYD
ncbi:TPA: antitermination protein [Salmonella enterica subsp. enterica serovar Typhimurium]|uniref:Antitermination protein n=3 Tax=Salmonella enterica TaxID=28901 RepID=A0A754VSE5_SALER|nr:MULTISPECIES: antitermination protein [Salmonella]EBU6910459.1 antitermination protein [Salmonella enterica subsp. enterica serovar Typhimurium]EBU7538849.1 antitermination protein [Salmonella enterica subsp. salamae serovar Sofia]MCL8916685.1 antitermination protein [Salmonella enterica subsp. enterica serovar Enteritidis]QXX14979.1 antitermination protein [Salmonella enterica subsp. salamae]HAS9093193.1 antitermination protein [Salmonella enterica subsp. enterica serovar 4,12:i:-]HBM1568